MIGIGGRRGLLFTRKEAPSFPRTPILPQEKRGMCRSACPATARRATADCRDLERTRSHPYSQSERFMFAAGKRFTLRSNASRRIFPALHGGLHRKPPPSSRKKSGVFAAAISARTAEKVKKVGDWQRVLFFSRTGNEPEI